MIFNSFKSFFLILFLESALGDLSWRVETD